MVHTVFLVLFLVLCLYGALIFAYWYWFSRLRPFAAGTHAPATTFSVLIPARNEAENIGACLDSVLGNRYPAHLFEVWVIDDFSEDDTAAIVTERQAQHPHLHLLRLGEVLGERPINSYKKKAIEMAIGQAQHNFIVTTDADCLVHTNWLALLDAYIQENDPVFVAAPVMFTHTGSFVSLFQCLDFISLQGITAASVSAGVHSMCNGANLCYSRAAFQQVNGFRGIDHIASGDDMLLMHKLQREYPGRIGYLYSRESIVYTAPMASWRDFLNQRIRWASKATYYQDRNVRLVLVLVYLLNAGLFLLPLLAFLYPVALLYWLELLVVKTLFEFPFMLSVARFYRLQRLMRWFGFLQPVHIAYTVVAGWLGKFGTYRWKGRRVK